MTTMNELATVPARETGLAFPNEKVELLKRTICQGATDDELELFIHACRRTGLDPFMRQIHAVKRYQDGKETMAIQTGIDGYRLIAERSERYMPGREPTFAYDKEGYLISATAYVKKLDKQGQWHEVAATARFDEYAGKKKGGDLTSMWANKSHIMLAKCAEALVLRKAFPAELSGVYTKEEMEQADNPPAAPPAGGRQQSTPPQQQQQTKPIEGEEMPDYADDAVFKREWTETLTAIEWTADEAEKGLLAVLGRRKTTLDKLDAVARGQLIEEAHAGRFNQARDMIRRRAAEQQEINHAAEQQRKQAGGEVKGEKPAGAKPPEPAKQQPSQEYKPAPVTDAEVASWEAFLNAAKAEGERADIVEKEFDDALFKALIKVGKVGKVETTRTTWRREQLEAMRVGAFDWSTGMINRVTEALA